MMNYQYDALAASVRLKDITSSAENRALLHRIKNNDPALTFLTIDDSYLDYDEEFDSTLVVRLGDDLGWLGYFIGRNETLKSLYVFNLTTRRDRIETFFDGTQHNKSIKVTEFGGDLPSFAFSAINLPHVTTLEIYNNIDSEKAYHLAAGLQRCMSLEKYCYHGPITAEIAESLAKLPALEQVTFHKSGGMAIRRDECAALGKLLAKATNMKQLDIFDAGFDFENDGLKLLAEGLACNSSLADGELDLSNSDVGNEGLQALASSLASNSKLRKLILINNNIGDAGLEALADSLVHNRALRFLSVAGNTAITATGLRAISRILQSRKSRLEDLHLDRININDEGGKVLANALSINKSLVKLSLRCVDNGVSIGDEGLRALSLGLSCNATLRSLDLSGNTAITASGLRSLEKYFRSPSCALENLTLYEINGDEGAHALAHALSRNKSVKELDFYKRGITLKGWTALLKLLCDTSSPNSIYLSNHTLRDLGSWWYLRTRSDVQNSILHWLKTNKTHETPNLAAKFKILHFFPDLDMVPLFQWNLRPLPLVKGWFDTVTSSNDEFAASIQNRKLSAIYNFVRGLPVLIVDDLQRYLAGRVKSIRAKISALEEEERRLMQV